MITDGIKVGELFVSKDTKGPAYLRPILVTRVTDAGFYYLNSDGVTCYLSIRYTIFYHKYVRLPIKQ